MRITPTSLLLAFEELSETGDLDLGERPQEQESEEAFLLPQQQGPTPHTADTHPMCNWVVVCALPPLPLKDNNGQPLFNDDGSVTQGRVLIASADESGKWAVPPAFIQNMQQYADVSPGNLKNLKAGDTVDPRQFTLINMQYMKAKAAVQSAWKTEKLASADGQERSIRKGRTGW